MIERIAARVFDKRALACRCYSLNMRRAIGACDDVLATLPAFAATLALSVQQNALWHDMLLVDAVARVARL